MKTLNLALVALFLVSALTSLAAGEGDTGKKKVKRIAFERAIENPTLVNAMYAQLTDEFLEDEQPIYAVRVIYQGETLYVVGTYEQWEWFFKSKKLFMMKKTIKEAVKR